MKIYLPKNQLNSRLRTIGKIIKRNATIAEMECFKFDVKEDGIEITGADTEGEMSTFLNCMIEGFEPSVFLVNSKTILDALKELPEQPLNIEVTKSKESFNLKLKYHNGLFEFVAMKADLFPSMREVDRPVLATLKASLLTQAFRTVSKFTGTDDLRPILTGVSISSKNNHISFAATNGNKMAMYEDKAGNEVEDFKFVVANKCVGIISGLLQDDDSEITFEIGDNNFKFTVSDYQIRYRLTEGVYPNYRAVIPKSFTQNVVVSTSDILSAIKRVSVFSSDATKTIIMNIGESILEISAQDIDFLRSANETLHVENDGSPIKIGFNSNFILDVFSSIEEEKAELHLTDPSKAVIVCPLNDRRTTILIMPVLINN